MTFHTKFFLVCFDLRPPNNPITAWGATLFPGYHSFAKWAIRIREYIMRAAATILGKRASEYSSNFSEQLEQWPNFASTFKLHEWDYSITFNSPIFITSDIFPRSSRLHAKKEGKTDPPPASPRTIFLIRNNS